MNLSSIALKRIGAAGIFILLFTLGLREIAPGPTSAPDYSSGQSGPEIIIKFLREPQVRRSVRFFLRMML